MCCTLSRVYERFVFKSVVKTIFSFGLSYTERQESNYFYTRGRYGEKPAYGSKIQAVQHFELLIEN